MIVITIIIINITFTLSFSLFDDSLEVFYDGVMSVVIIVFLDPINDGLIWIWWAAAVARTDAFTAGDCEAGICTVNLGSVRDIGVPALVETDIVCGIGWLEWEHLVCQKLSKHLPVELLLCLQSVCLYLVKIKVYRLE